MKFIGGWTMTLFISKKTSNPIGAAGMRYQSAQASFADMRAALVDCVRAHGALAYIAPGT